MYRRFIATIVAASVALTVLGAVPARADQKDTARAVAAIVGLAIVGKLVHDRKKEKEQERAAAARAREVARQQEAADRYHYTAPLPRSERGHRQGQGPRPRPLPQRVDRKLLPQECFRGFETAYGTHLMFGRRCLENNYRFANRLPQTCAERIRTIHGFRRGYDARCLRRAGYSLARR